MDSSPLRTVCDCGHALLGSERIRSALYGEYRDKTLARYAFRSDDGIAHSNAHIGTDRADSGTHSVPHYGSEPTHESNFGAHYESEHRSNDEAHARADELPQQIAHHHPDNDDERLDDGLRHGRR